MPKQTNKNELKTRIINEIQYYINGINIFKNSSEVLTKQEEKQIENFEENLEIYAQELGRLKKIEVIENYFLEALYNPRTIIGKKYAIKLYEENF